MGIYVNPGTKNFAKDINDDSFLLYGNGILYGGYRNKAT